VSIRRRKRIPIAVPIASMGDIAFLLIIFFILASTFMQEGRIKFERPESTDLARLKQGTVSVIMDEKGDLYVQGTLCAVEGLEGEVRELLKGLKEEDKQVMLKVHKDLPESKYGPVLMALGEVTTRIAMVGIRKNP